jgi:hypothetical protein
LKPSKSKGFRSIGREWKHTAILESAPTYTQIFKAMKEYEDIGAKVQVTEFDIQAPRAAADWSKASMIARDILKAHADGGSSSTLRARTVRRRSCWTSVSWSTLAGAPRPRGGTELQWPTRISSRAVADVVELLTRAIVREHERRVEFSSSQPVLLSDFVTRRRSSR